MHPQFLELIEDARSKYKSEGGISAEEMRRGLVFNQENIATQQKYNAYHTERKEDILSALCHSCACWCKRLSSLNHTP